MLRSFRDVKSSGRSSLSLEMHRFEANLNHCRVFSACICTVLSIIALQLHYSVFMSAAFRDSGQTLITSGALEN